MTTRERREVNARLRAADQSHLWPISGKFNATDRAIRTVSRDLTVDTIEEYEAAVDAEISRIVNDEDNW